MKPLDPEALALAVVSGILTTAATWEAAGYGLQDSGMFNWWTLDGEDADPPDCALALLANRAHDLVKAGILQVIQVEDLAGARFPLGVGEDHPVLLSFALGNEQEPRLEAGHCPAILNLFRRLAPIRVLRTADPGLFLLSRGPVTFTLGHPRLRIDLPTDAEPSASLTQGKLS